MDDLNNLRLIMNRLKRVVSEQKIVDMVKICVWRLTEVFHMIFFPKCQERKRLLKEHLFRVFIIMTVITEEQKPEE